MAKPKAVVPFKGIPTKKEDDSLFDIDDFDFHIPAQKTYAGTFALLSVYGGRIVFSVPKTMWKKSGIQSSVCFGTHKTSKNILILKTPDNNYQESISRKSNYLADAGRVSISFMTEFSKTLKEGKYSLTETVRKGSITFTLNPNEVLPLKKTQKRRIENDDEENGD